MLPGFSHISGETAVAGHHLLTVSGTSCPTIQPHRRTEREPLDDPRPALGGPVHWRPRRRVFSVSQRSAHGTPGDSRREFPSARRSRPRLSLGFLRVPFVSFKWPVSWPLSVPLFWWGFWPAGMLVKVAGLEPAASSSRTGTRVRCSAIEHGRRHSEHAQRRSLSVPFGDPAQQERPPPFLVRASGLREYLVGVTGFEPAASSSRTSRSRNYVGG